MITSKREREREREDFKFEIPQWVKEEEDNLDQEFIDFWKDFSTPDPKRHSSKALGWSGNCPSVNAIFIPWTCPKCGKLSSFQDLQLHEIYECESQQAQPSPQVVQQQIIQLNQVINQVQNLANKIQVASQKINNNSSLTPQQKQQALGKLNNPANGLANLLTDCQAKKNKLNALLANAPQRGNNSTSKTNYLPWIVGGMLGMGVIVGLVVWLVMRNKKST